MGVVVVEIIAAEILAAAPPQESETLLVDLFKDRWKGEKAPNRSLEWAEAANGIADQKQSI
jgi:hypothetical protein